MFITSIDIIKNYKNNKFSQYLHDGNDIIYIQFSNFLNYASQNKNIFNHINISTFGIHVEITTCISFSKLNLY